MSQINQGAIKALSETEGNSMLLEKKRVKTGGRQKGVCNKTTSTAKEAIAIAADRLGGVDRLVEWCKEDPLNEKAFWSTIYPKLLPLQVTGEGGGAVQIESITRKIVK